MMSFIEDGIIYTLGGIFFDDWIAEFGISTQQAGWVASLLTLTFALVGEFHDLDPLECFTRLI